MWRRVLTPIQFAHLNVAAWPAHTGAGCSAPKVIGFIHCTAHASFVLCALQKAPMEPEACERLLNCCTQCVLCRDPADCGGGGPGGRAAAVRRRPCPGCAPHQQQPHCQHVSIAACPALQLPLPPAELLPLAGLSPHHKRRTRIKYWCSRQPASGRRIFQALASNTLILAVSPCRG